APNAGTVRFEEVSPSRTRVRLAMEYEPKGVVESIGDSLGALGTNVQRSVEGFKEFIESRGREEGGWRGEVHGGERRGWWVGEARRLLEARVRLVKRSSVRSRAWHRDGRGRARVGYAVLGFPRAGESSSALAASPMASTCSALSNAMRAAKT